MTIEKHVQLHIFRAFKKAHGHLFIPAKFVVPNNTALYPVEFHNFKLGKHTNEILKQLDNLTSKSKFKRNELKILHEMGFVKSSVEFRAALYLDAFRKYKEKFDTTIMKDNFVVPSDDFWPEAAWGVNLGNVLTNIVENRDYESIRPQLAELGFSIGLQTSSHRLLAVMKQDSEYFQNVCDAVHQYRLIHNHVDIPTDFQVPPDDLEYSEHLRGMKLGTIIKNVRKMSLSGGLDPKFRQSLIHLGIIEAPVDSAAIEMQEAEVRAQLAKQLQVKEAIRSSSRASFQHIFAALQTHLKTHGHLELKIGWEVPADPIYPEEMWGRNLGRVLRDMREKGTYAQHSAKLATLGIFPRQAATQLGRRPVESPDLVEID